MEYVIERLVQLQRITAALAEAPTAREVAAVFVEQLRAATGAEAGALYELTPDGEQLILLHASGGSELLDNAIALAAPPSITATVQAREPAWFEAAPARAAVPLLLKGRVSGAFVLTFSGERRFPSVERDFLGALAQEGALALERAELLAAEREARQRAEWTADRLVRLQTLTAALAEVLSPEGAAQVVIEQAVVAMEALAGSVALMSGDGQSLELAAQLNLSEDVYRQLKRFSVHDSMLMAEAVRTGAPIFLHSQAPGAERSPWLSRARALGKSGSLATVPLVSGGRTIGSMGLAFEDLREFGAEDREFVIAMGQQCSQALERVRLYAAERKARAEAEVRERQTSFLANASALLSSSLDDATTLSTIAQLAVSDLADWCIIDLVDDDGSTTRLSVTHREPEKADLTRELWQDYPLDPKWPDGIAKTLRSGESQLVPRIPDSLINAIGRTPRHAAVLRGLGYKSGMAVALKNRGTIIGAITFVRSTDERPYEPADLSLAEALASRAAVAIDNAKLYAQAMEAIKARDSFISVASHELRTPLSTFKLGVDVLSRIVRTQQAELTDRIPVVLDKVRGQSDRLERLVSQLMDVSRLSAGRLKLEPEPVDLVELVREATARFADEATTLGVELSVKTPERVPAHWDRLRIDQVITNLLSNAMKYGRGTPIEVTAELFEGEAQLCVRDGGVGIAPEDQKRIFDRFERAVGDRRITGLGLGLWIVREIVKAHGGRIAVESAPGQGAAFIIALPLKVLGTS